mgnify:CR=1 FL=1
MAREKYLAQIAQSTQQMKHGCKSLVGISAYYREINIAMMSYLQAEPEQDEDTTEKDGEGDEDEEQEEDDTPKPAWKPPPVTPKEEARTGANKKTYFVCNERRFIYCDCLH